MDRKNKLLNIFLDLNFYKVYRCLNNNCKKGFKCFYYHNKFDKRRRVYNYTYYPKKCMCNFNNYDNDNNKCNCKDKSNCCKGIKCEYSHNIFEILYHPLKYKTQFCNTIDCNFEKFCCNAHNYHEIKINILHFMKYNANFFMFKFKTEFCPIIKNHVKKYCVYAHNYQEFRRVPNNYFINKDCETWNKDNIIPNIYNEKCKYNCFKFHGWKEYDYHPINYKKTNCKEIYNCKNKYICPNIHFNYFRIKDKKIFIKIPKNKFSRENNY